MIELVRIFSGMKMRVELHAHRTPNVCVIHAMLYPCFFCIKKYKRKLIFNIQNVIETSTIVKRAAGDFFEFSDDI